MKRVFIFCFQCFHSDDAVGSPLARFLRRNSSSLSQIPHIRSTEKKEVQRTLSVFSDSIQSLNLHACVNVESFDVKVLEKVTKVDFPTS